MAEQYPEDLVDHDAEGVARRDPALIQAALDAARDLVANRGHVAYYHHYTQAEPGLQRMLDTDLALMASRLWGGDILVWRARFHADPAQAAQALQNQLGNWTAAHREAVLGDAGIRTWMNPAS